MTTEVSHHDLLPIGFVVRPHGLKGLLRLRLHNPLSEALERAKQIFMLDSMSSPFSTAKPYKLESVHPTEPGILLVQLRGINRREMAEEFHGYQVLIDRSLLPSLDESEAYVSDLVGYEVFSNTKKVGVVSNILSMGGQELLQIKSETQAEILVPLVPEMISSIDKKDRTICIDPPEGLLELNYEDVKKVPLFP